MSKKQKKTLVTSKPQNTGKSAKRDVGENASLEKRITGAENLQKSIANQRYFQSHNHKQNNNKQNKTEEKTPADHVLFACPKHFGGFIFDSTLRKFSSSFNACAGTHSATIRMRAAHVRQARLSEPSARVKTELYVYRSVTCRC